MALGPSFKLSDTLETRLFIESRRLELIARHPDSTNASTECFRNEAV
jgi:hypothetical protein